MAIDLPKYPPTGKRGFGLYRAFQIWNSPSKNIRNFLGEELG